MDLTIRRLCRQLIEDHGDFSESVILGMQPRGIFLAARIKKQTEAFLKKPGILCGDLDITFFRDDVRHHPDPILASKTNVEFSVEGKKVILVDDVLFTGRTVRAALEAILQFGRPARIQLLVLIDRKFSRHLPVEADYIGKAVDTRTSQKVKVTWKETEGEDCVWLIE